MPSQIDKVDPQNLSYLVQNLRQHKALDKNIGEAVINYINNKFSSIEPKNLAVALKCLQEQLFMTDLLSKVNWADLDYYLFDAIGKDNNMIFLTNLSYLERYFSKNLQNKLFKQSLNRVQNESKMEYIKSRYFALNLTALARLYMSKVYDIDQKK